MSSPEIIRSVGDLVKYVKRIKSQKGIIWFRGHRDAAWHVQPAIWRKITPYSKIELTDYARNQETDLTNRFRDRARTRYASPPAYSDRGMWLSLMQHYGLPTRLLDWTRSPLVAAYFALEKYIYEPRTKAQEANIWILDPHKLNEFENLGHIGNLTPSIDSPTCEPMLKPAFIGEEEETNKVLAVMGGEHDMRMFVQQGCFTIHSYQGWLDKSNRYESYLTKLTIPSRSVKKMAGEIDVCGFRKGDIYPDLGHLAEELQDPHIR